MRNSYFIYLFIILVLQISTGVFAGTVQVTTLGTVNEINAGAISITGGASGAPEATATNSHLNAAAITTPITTLTNNAWLIDVVGSGNGGSFSSGAGQAESWDTSASSGTGASSTRLVATVGLDSMTQTHSTTSNRTAHAVMAVAPATTIALDSTSSANITTSSILSWTHTFSSIEAKLVVAIAVEENCSGDEVVTGVTYDGAPLTFVTAITVGTGFCQRVELWYLDTGVNLQAYYRMDESSWTGTAGEVVDETGSYSGTAQNGAQTADTSPAIAVDPGTCGYGSFDDAGGSSGDYIEIPGFPNQTTDFTITAWIRTNDNTREGQRIFADDENNTGGYALSLGDPGTGRLRFYSRSITPATIDTPTVDAITNDTWYFVAGTADITGSQIRIYIYNTSGTLVDSVVGDFTGSWASDAGVASIGGETNSGETTNRFLGNVDEVRFYGSALTQAQIEVVLSQTHGCLDQANIIVSTLENSKLGGLDIDQDEAVQYDGTTGTIFLAEATFLNNANTYGLHAIDDGTGNILIATDADETIDNVTFGDDDIVRVSPTGTAGVYDSTVIVFDGGMNFASTNEKIDAVYQKKSDGNIILSTRRSARLPQCGGGNLNFRDNDLVEWDTGSNCATMFLDESEITPDFIPNIVGGDEDINGVHLLNDDPNLILFTLVDDNTIRGTSVVGGDVILYNVSDDTVSIYFSESEFTSGSEDVSAVTLAVDISIATVDHYAISYPLGTPGVTCEAPTVRITAHDSSDVAIAPGSSTTITLSTSPAVDSWALKSGGGSFTAPNQYTFDSSETYVDLYLTETTATSAPHIDIDVTDGTATDNDGVSEDDNIEFSDAVFRFFAGGAGESIGKQIAGKESDIAPDNQTIQLRSVVTNTSTMACESRIQNTQTIEMAYKCNNPTTCESTAIATRVQIDDTTDIAPGNDNADTIDESTDTFSNVDLNFGATGTATFTFDFNDVGQIQLYARKTIAASAPDPAYTIFGTSNMFVVRPFGFDVQATGNPAATSAAGTKFTEAGEDFEVTVRAVVWDSGSDDGNPVGTANDGIPDGHESGDTDPSNNTDLSALSVTPNFGQEATDEDIDLNALLNQPGGGTDPGLDGETITTFTSGSGNSTTVNYDEVGIIEIRAEVATDQDYLGGGAVIGKSGYVGRFYPDYFVLSDQRLVNRSDIASSTCTPGFTYMGENFEIGYDLTAKNVGGGTTKNYTTTSGFARLDTVSELNYRAVDTSTPVDLDSRLSTGAPTINFVGGVANVLTDTRSLSRAGAEDGPYSLSVGIRPEDEDGVQLNSFDLAVVTGNGDTHALIDTTTINYGRAVVENTFGSELIKLEMPLHVEIFDGANFVINVNDSDCTSIATSNLTLSNDVETAPQTDGDIQVLAGQTSDAEIDSDPISSGDARLSFCPPGPACTPTSGNAGYIDVEVDLSPSGLNYPWLQYDWDGDGNFDNNPSARATFGIYKGNVVKIYIQQVYQ